MSAATPNYHISIDYQDNSVEDRRANVYEAVVLMIPGGEEIRFETNDPVEDFKSVTRLAYAMQIAKPGAVFTSSSVDHFVKDVAGYRWGDGDLIEEDPNDPPILVTDKVDYDALTRDEQYAVAVVKSTLRTSQQAAYTHSKAYPALRSVFLAADREYRAFCLRFDLIPEPIHDTDHWKREKLAMGDALVTEVYGRRA